MIVFPRTSAEDPPDQEAVRNRLAAVSANAPATPGPTSPGRERGPLAESVPAAPETGEDGPQRDDRHGHQDGEPGGDRYGDRGGDRGGGRCGEPVGGDRAAAWEAVGEVVSGSGDLFPGDRGGAVAGVDPDAASGHPRPGRLVRRWLPAPLQQARWEPGRPGAVMLSLVAALAAVLAAVGVWRDRPVPETVPALPLVAPSPAPSSADAAPELVVSVVGRVARPGLVRLPEGARVADALDVAGGALPGTDLLGLNLARRLADGEQLLVGVAAPPGQQAPDGVLPGDPPGAPARVNLNTATAEQLDALPGIGPVTAQRILDWRAAHGPFTSVDQLREVSGIGEARFARLKELVRV